MTLDIFIQTTFPIFFLIGMGIISRKLNLLMEGDYKVLNAYLYYFALPFLILVNLSEMALEKQTYKFIIVGMVPIIIVLIIYLLFQIIFRIPKNTIYLIIITTIYANTAFFGIPFITFAFGTKQAENLAILTVSSISTVVTIITILILELYKLETTTATNFSGIKIIIKRFLINPLILSVIVGIIFSIAGIKIPLFIYNPLKMIGGTTSTIAIFMLGAFIYGKKVDNIFETFKLSLLKIIFLPALTIIILKQFNLSNIENYILVLMHGMPLGLTMAVLSEQYDFYKQTIASLILISSIVAGIYLNIWLEIVEKIF